MIPDSGSGPKPSRIGHVCVGCGRLSGVSLEPARCTHCGQVGRPIGPDFQEMPRSLPRLVAAGGPRLFICEGCVRLCTEIFEEDDLIAGD